MNYDKPRGEYFGKLMIKDHGQLVSKQRDAQNVDISMRISEVDVVDQISTVYHINMGYWHSKFCHTNRMHPSMTKVVTNCLHTMPKSKFKLHVTITSNDNDWFV